jgi:hypothetical protein
VGESGNVEVTLEIEDREKHVAIGKITADAVRVHITGAVWNKAEAAAAVAVAVAAGTVWCDSSSAAEGLWWLWHITVGKAILPGALCVGLQQLQQQCEQRQSRCMHLECNLCTSGALPSLHRLALVGFLFTAMHVFDHVSSCACCPTLPLRTVPAGNAKHESSQQEILALMAKTLTLRLTNLTLLRGSSSHSRVLVVEMLNTRQVYARLRGVPMPQRQQDKPGFRKPKPWHHGL